MKLPKEILLSELLNYNVKGNRALNYGIGENVWMHPPVHRILGWYSRPSNFDLKRNVWRLNQITQIINNEGELYVALEDIEEGREEPFHKDLSDPEVIKSTEQKTKWRHLGTAISSYKDMVYDVSYLLEGLKVISSSKILLKCSVLNKPAILVSEADPNEFIYLVMPCGQS